MKITDKDKIAKRIRRKKMSDEVARELLGAMESAGLKVSRIKKRLLWQFYCDSKWEIYSNGVIRSKFCGQKTCITCNSIRMAKFASLYTPPVNEYKYSSMLVLTMESAYSELTKNHIDKIVNFRDFLGNRVDDMFKFWHNSIMCKMEPYKKFSKEVHILRTWEITFNKKLMFHPHFHLLLVSNSNDAIENLGNFIITQWINWWERKDVKCVREAQKLEPLRNSILEVMHYCLKPTDLKNGNPLKVIELIKAVESRRLFSQRGFKSMKELKAINSRNISDINENRINDINGAIIENKFEFDHELGGFYSKATGEVIE
jgi:Replication protein